MGKFPVFRITRVDHERGEVTAECVESPASPHPGYEFAGIYATNPAWGEQADMAAAAELNGVAYRTEDGRAGRAPLVTAHPVRNGVATLPLTADPDRERGEVTAERIAPRAEVLGEPGTGPFEPAQCAAKPSGRRPLSELAEVVREARERDSALLARYVHEQREGKSAELWQPGERERAAALYSAEVKRKLAERESSKPSVGWDPEGE